MGLFFFSFYPNLWMLLLLLLVRPPTKNQDSWLRRRRSSKEQLGSKTAGCAVVLYIGKKKKKKKLGGFQTAWSTRNRISSTDVSTWVHYQISHPRLRIYIYRSLSLRVPPLFLFSFHSSSTEHRVFYQFSSRCVSMYYGALVGEARWKTSIAMAQPACCVRESILFETAHQENREEKRRRSYFSLYVILCAV